MQPQLGSKRGFWWLYLYVTYPQPCVRLLVFYSSLVSLPSLLLEDLLHLSHSMLDDGGRDGSELSRDVRVAAESVLTRPKLGNCIKSQNVADVDILESRDGDQVAGSEDELLAGEGGTDVVGRL